MKDLTKILLFMQKKALAKLSKPESRQQQEFAERLDAVYRQWQMACHTFNYVCAESDVDAAIAAMAAAEENYKQMIEEARSMGYRIPVTLDRLKERRGFYA